MAKLDSVLLTLAAAGAAGMLLLPASGTEALANELAGAVMFLACGLWLLKAAVLLRSSGEWKNMLCVACAAAVLLCLSGAGFVKTAADMTQGSRHTVLYNCEVQRRMGIKGIFSLRYTLQGEDEAGNRCRLALSGSHAQALDGARTVTVEYYAHTKRVVSFK